MSRTTTTRRGWPVIVLAVAVFALLLSGCSGGKAAVGASSGGKKVAFLLPENVLPRWENQDKPFLMAALAKYAPSAKLMTFNAENDASKQQRQAEQALTEGAAVLVVIAVDQKAAGVIVNQARAANVPVVAYDRLILDSPVDYYVSVDGTKVGELQGKWLAGNTHNGDNIAIINGSETDDNAHLFNKGYMSVLKPLFDAGTRKMAYEAWTPGWDPSTAQTEMEQALTKAHNNIQGVLSANDGMAASIVTVLGAQGLAGKVPVTGLDGTTQALQLILQGNQGMTVYRSLKEQADKTGQIVSALLSGEKPANGLFTGKPVNNGKVDIPWATVTPMVIDKTNVKIVMDETGLKPADVCTGVTAGVGPC